MQPVSIRDRTMTEASMGATGTVTQTVEVVHVLLPVHNRRVLTQRFLQSLHRQSYPRIRLMVIDDGSTDGTAAMVREEYPGAVVLPGSGTLWWSGSLQCGIDRLAANGLPDEDIVLIANDDTVLDPSFVERGVQVLRGLPHALLCARLLNPGTGAALESGIHVDWLKFVFRPANKAGEIDCLPTRGLFLRWRDIKRIGAFRPRLLPHYWSDYEYTIRARKLGYRCVTHPSVALRASLDTTGYHDLDALIGGVFLRRYFSVKSPLNPLYRSAFVWLAAPAWMKLPALMNIWGRALPRIVWQGLARRPYPKRLRARSYQQ
jgi:GT2 family glycosyltransferase